MASNLEQNQSCTMCCMLLRDPVVLSCSHRFCRSCLKYWWKDKPQNICLLCRKNPPLNLADTSTEESEQTAVTPEQTSTSQDQPECSLHSEKLMLFCEDHQDLVCLVCRDSETHKDHSFIPIEEAAQDLREQLRTNIRPLDQHLKLLNWRSFQMEFSAAHISVQAGLARTQIRAEFNKLRQFLREEEESRMKAVSEEEEQKTRRMKEMAAAVIRDMETVSQTISETEEQLRAGDTSFLLQYKSAAEKVQRCPLLEEPRMEAGALMDQAKHLGNLGFNVWRNMKSLVHFYPLLLDPNRAGCEMEVSEDLSSVTCGDEQELPQNPERRRFYDVDGCEELISGTHSWVVEVGGNEEWWVGVRGSVQRGDNSEEGRWFINSFGGQCTASSPSDPKRRLSAENLRRVRVKLDLGTKTLTFSEPDTNTEIHTFSDFSTLIGGLRPYIATDDQDAPLKILPKDITVTV